MGSVERLNLLRSQLKSNLFASRCAADASTTAGTGLLENLRTVGVYDIEVDSPPSGAEGCYERLLSTEAVKFIADLVRHFGKKVDEVLQKRISRKIQLDQTNQTPDFLPHTAHIRESDWMVAPVPYRLLNRHLDLGDVSPSNTKHFKEALKSPAQGIQVDFDDGHCPTWANQLIGMNNIYEACHNILTGVKEIKRLPVLMLRPRAWNMIETHMLVGGKEVPGPLFDFGLLMYHNAHILHDCASGPYFYLSKLEGHEEARLWNEIFVWSQNKLGLPVGSIKACVLIENVLATFEMHEILYELRDHSAGLNCGIWDYSASFVNKFGMRPEFVLPDRKKYVSMERHFLSSYMDLLVQTCHRRGCHATGGMAALLLPPSEEKQKYKAVVESVCRSKLREIKAGVDGFMVYDVGLLQPVLNMWEKFSPSVHQFHVRRKDVRVNARDLLLLPKGGVTDEGLSYNIAVGILFIYSWLNGKGHFYYRGAVEDSATAEISRSQVWQWIRHGAKLEDSGIKITKQLVKSLVTSSVQQLLTSTHCQQEKLREAAGIFTELVCRKDFPEFITTYLSQQHAFTKYHG